MKRFILVLVFILSVSGLFAKDKTLFNKKSRYSSIGLYEVKDPQEFNDFRYYISISETDFEGGELLYLIVSNNYTKIQTFLTENYKAGNKLKEPLWAFYPDYYTFLHDDLVLDYKESKIDSKRNIIVDYRVWILK